MAKTIRKPRKQRSTLLEPMRLNAAEAAAFLGIGLDKFNGLVARGVFTVQRDSEKARSIRYFPVDELRCYVQSNMNGDGREGEAAVMALRRRLGRIRGKKRG